MMKRPFGKSHDSSPGNCMRYLIALWMFTFSWSSAVAEEKTYSEMLGWPAGSRVLILHVDDAGMSAESNRGTIRAVRDGVANSFSVMMPTPWVPEMVDYIKANPDVDAGLHLTLTAEWDHYRWGPLAGKPAVPGLVDREGALWASVAGVVEHGSAREVGIEIAAQLDRARAMEFEPTHLDSHMGTLFATPEFMAEYINLGVSQRIPIMFPGGHNFYANELYGDRAEEARETGRLIWSQGLPVLDDLHNTSYGWSRDEKVERYVEAIRGLKPGVTMMIMHCSDPSATFARITDSGPSRFGDLDAMLAPEVAAAIREEGIILTTWRELGERRQSLVQ